MRSVRFAFVALSSAIVTPAQGPAFSRVHDVLPLNLSATLFLHGDVDNDGCVDLVGIADTAASTSASNSVWRGTPDGMVAVPGAMPSPVRRAVSARLADLDGDADLDCVVLNAPASSTPCSPPYGTGVSSDVFWNDGTGQFTHGSAPLPAPGCPNYTCVEVGDVDGDGDADIVAGASPYMCVPNPSNPFSFTLNLGEDHLYLNDGTGGFTLAAGHLPPLTDITQNLSLADFDGDGDLDLFVGIRSGQGRSRIYTNNGAGVFTEFVGALPVNTQMQGGSVHPRDFDGDGDLDLLLHGVLLFAGNVSHLVNNGTGVFTDATATLPAIGIGLSQHVVTGDWNGDSRPDFVASESTGSANQVFTLTNQGGSFAITDVRSLPGRLLSWDLEGDGDQDLIAIGPRHNIARNDGTGQWHTVPADLPQLSNPVRALLDVDVDGDLDALAVFVDPGSPARLLRNEGNGRFSAQTSGDFTSNVVGSAGLLVGDVDGDGDSDVVVTTPVVSPPSGSCRLYRNVGGSLQQAPFPAVFCACGALGDLDGDGDLDVYLGRFGQDDRVLTNDGSGAFTLGASVSSFTLTYAVALTDVDGDGDLDAAIASTAANRVLLNTGNGTFVASNFQSSNATEVQAADVDGDGDQDLIFGNYGNALPDRLYRNNGLGSFTLDSGALPAPAGGSQWIRFADVDGDGDVDIVRRLSLYVTVPNNNHLQVLINDGTGHFAANTAQDLAAWAFEVGDLDGDNDEDLLFSDGDLRVHWNLQHQLTWRTLPRVGRPLTLDLHGRGAEPYALALATAPANLPIPGFGRLRLDPASLLLVQLGAYDAAGRATFVGHVPLTPSLTGVSLYWQALSGSVARLGNLEVTTLQVH